MLVIFFFFKTFLFCPLGYRACQSLWQQTVGTGSQAPERQTGEAVQRALAQPPQSQCQEVFMDG